MQLKSALLVVAGMLALHMPQALAAEGDVLRATRVVHTIIRQSPWLVESTTTVTWTQSASVTETASPTTIPDKVGEALQS